MITRVYLRLILTKVVPMEIIHLRIRGGVGPDIINQIRVIYLYTLVKHGNNYLIAPSLFFPCIQHINVKAGYKAWFLPSIVEVPLIIKTRIVRNGRCICARS